MRATLAIGAVAVVLAVAVAASGCERERPAARVGGGAPPAETRPGVPSGAEGESASRALDVAWVGDPDADAPLVVLLHGYGAPGRDLVPLAESLRIRAGEPLRFALPAAPIVLGTGARAWWTIAEFGRDRPADRGDEAPAGLAAARRDVTALLTRLREEGRLDPARTIIGGFSQGAMLATDVALEHDPPLAGLIVLSGGPVDEARWRERMRDRTFAVFQSHGRRDPLLAFDAAERLRSELADAGHDVTFVPFEGGHTIPPPVVAQLTAFLERAL